MQKAPAFESPCSLVISAGHTECDHNGCVVEDHTGRNGKVVALTIPLPILRSVHRRIPVLSVDGASMTLRDVVLVESVRVVELAKPRRLRSIVSRVVDVVLRSGIANGSTALGIERSIVSQQPHAHICIIIVAIKRSVDGLAGKNVEERRQNISVRCTVG